MFGTRSQLLWMNKADENDNASLRNVRQLYEERAAGAEKKVRGMQQWLHLYLPEVRAVYVYTHAAAFGGPSSLQDAGKKMEDKMKSTRRRRVEWRSRLFGRRRKSLAAQREKVKVPFVVFALLFAITDQKEK